MNELIYKTETDIDIKNKLMVTKGEKRGGGINLEVGINIYTLYKIDNHQGSTV